MFNPSLKCYTYTSYEANTIKIYLIYNYLDDMTDESK